MIGRFYQHYGSQRKRISRHELEQWLNKTRSMQSWTRSPNWSDDSWESSHTSSILSTFESASLTHWWIPTNCLRNGPRFQIPPSKWAASVWYQRNWRNHFSGQCEDTSLTSSLSGVSLMKNVSFLLARTTSYHRRWNPISPYGWAAS